MKELTVFREDDADFFQNFFWVYKHLEGTDVFSRLIAIDVGGKRVIPLYLPIFTFRWRLRQLTIWFNISRWQGFMFVINRYGIKTRYIDIRKEV